MFSRYVDLVSLNVTKNNKGLSTKEIRHKAWIEICDKKGWDE